jgi:hypothetical protein
VIIKAPIKDQIPQGYTPLQKCQVMLKVMPEFHQKLEFHPIVVGTHPVVILTFKNLAGERIAHGLMWILIHVAQINDLFSAMEYPKAGGNHVRKKNCLS